MGIRWWWVHFFIYMYVYMQNKTRKLRAKREHVIIYTPRYKQATGDVVRMKQQYDTMVTILKHKNIKITDINKTTNSTEYNPDIIFMRDSFVKTATHVIMGKFKRAERVNEPSIVKPSIMNALGTEVVELQTARSRLEGGDYLLNNGISFILAGQRTNKTAISEMVTRDLFGTKNTVAIHMTKRDTDMHRIHLDCMMNFIGNIAVVWEGLLHNSMCIIHDAEGGTKPGVSLDKCLKSLGYSIFIIDDEAQRQYACNFVNFDQFVLAQHPIIQRASNKETICIPFDEINKLYGGIHCIVHDV